MIKWLTTYNNAKVVKLSEIPVFDYPTLRQELKELLADDNYHLANYFAVPQNDEFFALYLVLLNDADASIHLASYRYEYYADYALESLVKDLPCIHIFERDITERYGIKFIDSTWNKPLRFCTDRYDKSSSINNYPFYKIEGESVHEVNVGPIHAGIIEPGAFRFNCNGEQVLHLEVALGYQHRNIEKLISTAHSRLKENLLCESIAGDSAVSHTTAYVSAIEKLIPNFTASERLNIERAMALELERTAMHLADLGALCMDVGYQLGQVAFEALRTIVINTTQMWCGNRFGKSLIRLCGTNHSLSLQDMQAIKANISDVHRRVEELVYNIKNTPSVLARFEECGTIERSQSLALGLVGVPARASGLGRDTRLTHPWGAYLKQIEHKPIVRKQGDIMARVMIRFREALQSMNYVLEMTKKLPIEDTQKQKPQYSNPLNADSMAISLVEGWRGEICHCVLTDSKGQIAHYRVIDPSLHNWSGLALVVRGEGISDFPICNKSFNLSYCGYDL